jgi:ABC-type transporter Mla subunit MlaD
MGEARQVVQDFRTSGEGLSRSLAETDRAVAVAVRPMQDAVQTLSQVQHALQAERAAFEGLRQTMASQAQAVEGLLKQYEGLTGALSDQMGTQLEQVGGTLENLQRGYRVFHEQTLAGMDAYQKQLLEFLPELERRLQFPGYVKELEQAMVMEVESRKDLSETLKRLGR